MYTPGLIAECRGKLAEAGVLQRPPLVIVGSKPTYDQNFIVHCVLLVSASQIARELSLKATYDGATGLIIQGITGKAKALKIVVGSRRAESTDGVRILTLPPERRGKEVFVPMRCVAEYFGWHVKWEPLPRIARVQ